MKFLKSQKMNRSESSDCKPGITAIRGWDFTLNGTHYVLQGLKRKVNTLSIQTPEAEFTSGACPL